MNKTSIFPFILKSDHESLLAEKENEINGLKAQISQLNQSINNIKTSPMTDEQFSQLQDSMQALSDKLTTMEQHVESSASELNDIKAKQLEFENKIKNILQNPGATSAVAVSATDPTVNDDEPRSVLSDIDLINDFESALAKVEEEYGK